MIGFQHRLPSSRGCVRRASQIAPVCRNISAYLLAPACCSTLKTSEYSLPNLSQPVGPGQNHACLFLVREQYKVCTQYQHLAGSCPPPPSGERRASARPPARGTRMTSHALACVDDAELYADTARSGRSPARYPNAHGLNVMQHSLSALNTARGPERIRPSDMTSA